MSKLETTRWRFLAFLHVFIGLTALLGGGALVVWSSGRMLGLSVAVLERSPFTDFLLPGVILYGAVGVNNLIAAFLVSKREPGAEVFSFIAGIALLICLVAATAMVSLSPALQMGCGVLALLVVLDAVWIRTTPHFASALAH